MHCGFKKKCRQSVKVDHQVCNALNYVTVAVHVKMHEVPSTDSECITDSILKLETNVTMF